MKETLSEVKRECLSIRSVGGAARLDRGVHFRHAFAAYRLAPYATECVAHRCGPLGEGAVYLFIAYGIAQANDHATIYDANHSHLQE